jgi:hypothetical protein
MTMSQSKEAANNDSIDGKHRQHHSEEGDNVDTGIFELASTQKAVYHNGRRYRYDTLRCIKADNPKKAPLNENIHGDLHCRRRKNCGDRGKVQCASEQRYKRDG